MNRIDLQRAIWKRHKRAKNTEYKKETCFFCDQKVATDNAGAKVKRAVELTGDDKFMVRLSAAMNPSDAQAMDVMYHITC